MLIGMIKADNPLMSDRLPMAKCFFYIILSSSVLLSNLSNAGSAKQIGDFGRYASPVAVLLITLAKQDLDGTKQFGLSFASSLALTEGLKRGMDEQRPRGGSNNAFPSGHTVWACTSASFLQQRYGWKYGLPGAFVAGVVGFSRVDVGAHHVHDVLAAAIISSALTYLFTKPIQFDKVKTNASTFINLNNMGFYLNIDANL